MTHEEAREIFAAGWELYVKYENGPQNDPDMYWHNLVADSAKIAQRLPCELTEGILKAILSEHDRRERAKTGSKGGTAE